MRPEALGPGSPQILLNRATCLQNLGRHDEALDIYRRLIAREPGNPGWHHSYNELLHRLGRGGEFLRSYDAAPASRPLLLSKAFFLGQDMRHAESLDVYESLLKQDGADRIAAIGAARCLARLGRHDKARSGFADLIAASADAGLLNLAAEAALLAGTPDEAAQLCERGLALVPRDGSCLAYLSTAWRLMGDERDEALCGYDTLVRIFDLEPPEGYADMAGFNAELNEALARLHPDTQGFLGQSLRGGSQTPEQLFDLSHPLIEKLKRRITEAVGRYIAELGDDALLRPASLAAGKRLSLPRLLVVPAPGPGISRQSHPSRRVDQLLLLRGRARGGAGSGSAPRLDQVRRAGAGCTAARPDPARHSAGARAAGAVSVLYVARHHPVS